MKNEINKEINKEIKNELNKEIWVFKECLKKQFVQHKTMEPQDVVKLCFQAAFGAEHLLTNIEAARNYFEKEYEGTPKQEGPLYEQISGQIFRVNLAAWKQLGFPQEWLFRMFVESAYTEFRENIPANADLAKKEHLAEYLRAAEEIIKENTNVNTEDWYQYLEGYCSKEPEAVHHSDRYRVNEQPAYRIVKGEYIQLFPLLEQISRMKASKAAKEQEGEDPFVIAIDGRAAAGKTTLAAKLQKVLQTAVIHMDDFFLPMDLRSRERFLEPGGNVHYERFREEVLPYLGTKEPFFYRKFDCSCMDFRGEVQVEAGEWRIVEGSYSMHPAFGSYADLTVFCDVEPDEQMNRIEKRNGIQMAEMFRTRWIPLEEAYFTACHIKEECMCVFKAEDHRNQN